MSIRDLLTLVAAVGSGLVAGVFFAFSAFVMRALAKLPATNGLAAMQSINVVVINPIFLGAFIGTAAVGVVLVAWALLRAPMPGGVWMIAGAAAYLVGTFGVTIACNVPLNDGLAKVALDAPDAAARWTGYVDRWTLWNHVRTVAAVLATIGFALAFRAGPPKTPPGPTSAAEPESTSRGAD